MTKEEFVKALKDVFWKYDKKQLRKAENIADTFAGKESEVFNHLYKKYRIPVEKRIPAFVKSAPKKVEAPVIENTEDSVEETNTPTEE